MSYDKSTRQAIFKLWTAGKPIEQINKKTGVSKTTIYKWRKQYGWDERNTEINKKVKEKVNESLAEMKAKQRNIIRGIQGRFIKQLRAETVDVTPAQVIDAMKHELHLMGEPETSTELTDKKSSLLEAIKELEEEARARDRLAEQETSQATTRNE